MINITAVGAGLGHLSRQTGGGHLATSHAVNGVIDEYDRNILVSGSGVNRFCHADGCQVTIALVSKDDILGPAALNAGGGGGCPAVGGLDHIAGEVIGALKIGIALTPYMELNIVPEYYYSLSKTEIYSALYDISPTIAGWSEGVKLNFGLGFFF